MFVGKARSLPKSDAFERCFTLVGSGLNRKHYTKLKRFARDKRSSLLQKGSKKFYNMGSRDIWDRAIKQSLVEINTILTIDIERPKIDCLSFVICPLLAQLKTGFFSSFFAAAVYSTNEANKAGLKQSIFLDVYDLNPK